MFGFNLVITGPQVLIHIGIFTDVLMKPMKKPRHLTQSYSYNDILRYHQSSSYKSNKNNDKLGKLSKTTSKADFFPLKGGGQGTPPFR